MKVTEHLKFFADSGFEDDWFYRRTLVVIYMPETDEHKLAMMYRQKFISAYHHLVIYESDCGDLTYRWCHPNSLKSNLDDLEVIKTVS